MATKKTNEVEESEPEPTENLGEKLRIAREAQEMSLDAVAAELRIGAEYLAALEDCRFDALGAPVFAKGYLKQYGARLGLDVDELVGEYESMAGDASVPITPVRAIRLRNDARSGLWVIVVATLVVLAGAGLIWWWVAASSAAN
jgi:cytoskeleton protein RodZ